MHTPGVLLPGRPALAGSGVGALRCAVFTALLGLFLALGFTAPAHAQAVQPVPPLSARVIDRSDTLGAQQLQALERKLASFEAERGSQIVVLLVPTTAPEDIAAYAFRVADAWKIGRRDVGDGVLLVVATQDRRIRNEVARALEGAIPDLAAWRIIDDIIAPAFRQGGYAQGIDAGVEALFALIRGEELPLPARSVSAPRDACAARTAAAAPSSAAAAASVASAAAGVEAVSAPGVAAASVAVAPREAGDGHTASPASSPLAGRR